MADDPWGVKDQSATDPWGVTTVTPWEAQQKPGGPTRIEVRPPGAAYPTQPVQLGQSTDPWGVAQQAQQQQPSEQKRGFFEGFFDPLTRSGPFQYTPEVARHGLETLGKGWEDIKSGNRLAGGIEALGGATEFATAPVGAALREFGGMPLEKAFGIPKEYTETALGLAIPYYGIGKTPKALEPVKAILSPQSMSAEAKDAAALLRKFGGTAARDTETTRAALEPYRAVINQLPDADRLAFIDYVEGGTQLTGGASTPQLRALADTLKDAFELRRTKLQNMPSTAKMHFITDYFPHMWKDPGRAQAFSDSWGGISRQGSGASLKKRTMPTIADGIQAGLEPISTDPIEMSMRYVQSMDRFIASTSALEEGKNAGTVIYVKPQVMGASGRPGAMQKIPDGYVPLEGRGARDASGAQAYAPADWARIYNNFLSRGFHQSAEGGKLYDAALSTSNAITGLELGMSGFHAYTMAQEAIISGVAKGISEIVGGRPFKGLKSIAVAPGKFITSARTGTKAEQVYLGRSPGTPDMRRIVDLAEEAGARMVGKAHAQDYRFTAAGSYFTSWKRAALKLEARQAMMEIKNAPGAYKLPVAAKTVFRQIGRVMETVAQPLFEKYIPKLKNGAFYDTMKSWLDANPQATHAEQVAMARKIWDSIDNRFGELVQDNIFWNAMLKQSAQLAMRSYSWNLGTFREIAGGIKGVLDDPSRLSMAHPEYDPRIAYTVALPVVVGVSNAVYQKLMTGKNSESMTDLVAGRTGGEVEGFGGRGTVEQRVEQPGYMKDVVGWLNDPRQELLNKFATGPRMAWELFITGKDWRGDPIKTDPMGGPAQAMADYLTFVGSAMVPISIRELYKGQEEGSQIPWWQRVSGFRQAPNILQDPEGTLQGLRSIELRDARTKRRHDLRQQRKFGGYDE
jgi:hypothetical protein